MDINAQVLIFDTEQVLMLEKPRLPYTTEDNADEFILLCLSDRNWSLISLNRYYS